MKNYEHTQPGALMRVLLGGIAAIIGTIGIVVMIVGKEPEAGIGMLATSIVMIIVLVMFHSLTVRVSKDSVSFAFGVGLIRKNIPLSDIESATAVKNRWHNGWGIKKIR